jgi:hypothetical protein
VKKDFPRGTQSGGRKKLTKNGAAKVGRRSRRVVESKFERWQIPVAFEINALDVENRLDLVTRQKRLGFVAAAVPPL